MKPIRVTFDELCKDYQRYFALAQREVITIVYGDGDELVLLNSERYARLCQSNGPIAMPVEALSEADLREIEQSEIPEETRELNSLLPEGWPEKE